MIVDCTTGGVEREYRRLIDDFDEWRQRNGLQLGANKTKEPVLDFLVGRNDHQLGQ